MKPREDSRGEKYDRALSEAPADIYLPATDYGAILTPSFDARILKAAQIWPDGIGVVYTKMCDELVPMLQAPTARYVETAGEGCIYSHQYPYWFVDHEMADMAWMIGRVNFADVVVTQEKRPNSTHRLRDVEFWAKYFEFMALDRRNRAKSVINSPEFQAPDWLKEQMSNWHPLVEMRSRARNQRVISNAKAMEADRGEQGPPDEGYIRAKLRAEKRLMDLYNTALRAAA